MFSSEEILAEFSECARVEEREVEVSIRLYRLALSEVERGADRYAEKRSTRTCSQCHGIALSGATRCASCVERGMVRYYSKIVVKRATFEYRADTNAKTRSRWESRRSVGQCTLCTSAAAPGLTKCQAHLDAVRSIQKKYKAKHKAQGKCARCNCAPVEGKSLCQRHREERNAADRARYLRRKSGLPK